LDSRVVLVVDSEGVDRLVDERERLAGRLQRRRLSGGKRLDLLAVLSRDSSGEVPMFEPADGGWVVE
jgi:hypothetical protein